VLVRVRGFVLDRIAAGAGLLLEFLNSGSSPGSSQPFNNGTNLDSDINNPATDPYSVEEKRADFSARSVSRVAALPGV